MPRTIQTDPDLMELARRAEALCRDWDHPHANPLANAYETARLLRDTLQKLAEPKPC